MKTPRLLTAIMFISTLALLATVSDTLGAARYSQPTPADPAVLSADPGDPKLFGKISFYPDRNLARALVDLRVTADRLALIVPLGDDYKSERKGQVVRSERTSELMVIIADRDFSINATQMGPTRHSPGILTMKDLTVRLLTQNSFMIEGRIVYFEPTAGAIVQMGWQEDNKPATDTKGRESWQQLFVANAGDQATEIGRRT